MKEVEEKQRHYRKAVLVTRDIHAVPQTNEVLPYNNRKIHSFPQKFDKSKTTAHVLIFNFGRVWIHCFKLFDILWQEISKAEENLGLIQYWIKKKDISTNICLK